MKPADRTPLTGRPGAPMVTRMGFGGAPLGNLYRPVAEADAQAALQAAHDGGLRFLDTAPLYGLGLSEERFAAAIARFGRDGITLSTKIGRLLEDCAPDEVTPASFVDTPQRRFVYDYSYDGVMRSHEASLKRLGVDRIDVLLAHDLCIFTHGSKEASDARIAEFFDRGGYRAMAELREQGVVSAIGAGVNEWEVCETLLRREDFDCFLLAGRYTLLEQEALDSFLPLCVQRDVGIILGGPYNSGILATGPVAGARYNYAPAPEAVMDKVRRMQAVCADHGVSLAAAALRFPLGHPAVKTVIPGAANAAEVRENLNVMAATIPAALWSDLRDQGLIRPDAPLPEKAADAA
jgi:D-threo-aldose 1-dehydrogenase